MGDATRWGARETRGSKETPKHRLSKSQALLKLQPVSFTLLHPPPSRDSVSRANFPPETMPHLHVDLNDPADCRRSIQIIRRQLGATADGPKPDDKPGSAKAAVDSTQNPQAQLPLRRRLEIIQQRGVWKHLAKIAKHSGEPRSLPEWDEELGLPRNKMRSLKANFAKLEKRFDVRFLRVAGDAVPDADGNPRYAMPPRIRNQILGLVEDEQAAAV